jgi:hypothetical protein
MYFQKVITKKKLEKNDFLLASCRLLMKRAGSGSGSVRQCYKSADPDLYQMSRIQNTAVKYTKKYIKITYGLDHLPGNNSTGFNGSGSGGNILQKHNTEFK